MSMGRMSTNLLELRESRGWSLRDVSKMTGIPISSLSEYERGLHIPWDDHIAKLSEVFGTPVEFSIPVSPVKRVRKGAA